MEEMKYVAPDLEIQELYSEGVLCGSNDDLDMDPVEGYM